MKHTPIYQPIDYDEEPELCGGAIIGALNAFAGMLLLGGAWFAVDFAIWAWAG